MAAPPKGRSYLRSKGEGEARGKGEGPTVPLRRSVDCIDWTLSGWRKDNEGVCAY